jgi:hypothetical protein
MSVKKKSIESQAQVVTNNGKLKIVVIGDGFVGKVRWDLFRLFFFGDF